MLTDREREMLIAAMDLILPCDDGPGARDADAIRCVEWLAGQDVFRRRLPRLRFGLDLMDVYAARQWHKAFLSCDVHERGEVMHRVHDTPLPQAQDFVALLVRVTLAGFLCPVKYGGNRSRVGWAFIGFEGGAP
jgi:hypothetical protein